MGIIRHPKLADDIRDAAMHYAEISERVLSAFWSELDSALASVERNPRSYHLIHVASAELILVVLRHD